MYLKYQLYLRQPRIFVFLFAQTNFVISKVIYVFFQSKSIQNTSQHHEIVIIFLSFFRNIFPIALSIEINKNIVKRFDMYCFHPARNFTMEHEEQSLVKFSFIAFSRIYSGECYSITASYKTNFLKI